MSHKHFSLFGLVVGLLVSISLGQSAPQETPPSRLQATAPVDAKQAAALESPNPDDYDVIEPDKWRTVKLLIELSHGGRCEITLLRPLPWIEMTKAKVNGTIELQMPEMGIAGPAKVVAIEPCPEIKSHADKIPPGKSARPVIGKFVTTNAKVIDLSIEGLDQAIGTTASHPFWSLDRKGWVAAGDLKPGEKLRTADGSATVKSITPRPGTETVYNLEVHKDHTFFVSDAKLWVHNNCLKDALARGARIKNSAEWLENAVIPNLIKNHGATREGIRAAIHRIKSAEGLGAADNLWIDLTGNCYNPFSGDWVGQLIP